MQMAKRVSLNRPWGLNRKPPQNRAVVPLHWAKHALTGRSGHTDRTLALSVWSPDGRHTSLASNAVRQMSMATKLTGRTSKTDRTLEPQRPVVSSKLPEAYFFDQTRPVHLDRTQPASGAQPFLLCRRVSATRHRQSASGASGFSVRSQDRRQHHFDQLHFNSNFFTLAQMCQPPRILHPAQ